MANKKNVGKKASGRFFHCGALPVVLHYAANKEEWDNDLVARFKADPKDHPYPTNPGRCMTWEDVTGLGYDRVSITINPVPGYDLVQVVALIAHEATHAVDYLYEAMNEKVRNTELSAYFADWVVANIFNAWCEDNNIKITLDTD